MSKTLLLFTILLSSLHLMAQTTWEWAEGHSSSDYDDFAIDMKVDNLGNVYVVGEFTSSQITFGTYTLNNIGDAGYTDIYIVKYNSSGVVQWAYNYGSTEDDEVKEIFIDNENKIIIVGSFSTEQINIGTETLTKNSETGRNIFIAKLDTDASVIWADNYGSFNDSGASAIATDNNNNIYIIGFFNGPSLSIGDQTVTNSSTGIYYDIYLAKLSPTGTPIWARSLQGADTQTEFGQNLAVDNQNNVIIHGDFWGTTSSLDFGSSVELTGNDVINYFVAKYDTDGNILWATKGDSDDNTCETRGRASIITDNDNNIYSHIYFEGDNYNFGSLEATSTCAGDDINSFILKLAPDGNELWLEHFNSITWSNVMGSTWSGLAISPENDLVVASAFNDSELTIDDITLTNTTSSAYTNFFVKFNPDGEAIWAETSTNNYHAGAVAVEIDLNGDLIVAGNFLIASIFFDSHEVENSGGWDAYIAKATDIPTSKTNINNSNNTITIFPNPSDGTFSISGEDITSVDVFNIQGQMTNQYFITDGSLYLDMSKEAKGLYILKIHSQNNCKLKKIIIQ